MDKSRREKRENQMGKKEEKFILFFSFLNFFCSN
jgi:hypothetical protein